VLVCALIWLRLPPPLPLLLLQVDSLEQALLAALPLGPQGAAGGVSLPDLFRVRICVVGDDFCLHTIGAWI
jgi:hypothetical protein